MPSQIPVDFKDIAKQSGKRQGTLFYSTTFKSWAVRDGNLPSIALIEAPPNVVRIENNCWIIGDIQ